MAWLCFSCQKELAYKGEVVGRRDECPHCHADLHVCKNCQHYDSRAYNECREPTADVVKEKDRSNFCDYFAPALDRASQTTKAEDLKAKANALFNFNKK